VQVIKLILSVLPNDAATLPVNNLNGNDNTVENILAKFGICALDKNLING